jgi:hypothetical protein
MQALREETLSYHRDGSEEQKEDQQHEEPKSAARLSSGVMSSNGCATFLSQNKIKTHSSQHS